MNESIPAGLKPPEFMDRFRKEVLEKGWDRKIRLSMLASKQGGRPSHEWAYETQKHNALLRGRSYNFFEEALHETLENIDADTKFKDWVETVAVEDVFLSCKRKERDSKGEMRNINSKQRQRSKTILPKLTSAERSMLSEHQGCFKCR